MKFLKLLTFLLLFSAQVLHANEKVREIISIIDEELAEVTRLNKNSNGNSPKFMLRMAELLLEKARFLKELELDKYLAIDPKERHKYKRKEFFFGSRKYFIQAQKTCLLMLKKFKKFDRVARSNKGSDIAAVSQSINHIF